MDFKPGDRVIYGWTRRGIEYGALNAGERIAYRGRVAAVKPGESWVVGDGNTHEMGSWCRNETLEAESH